jgi:hypothetical protein
MNTCSTLTQAWPTNLLLSVRPCGHAGKLGAAAGVLTCLPPKPSTLNPNPHARPTLDCCVPPRQASAGLCFFRNLKSGRAPAGPIRPEAVVCAATADAWVERKNLSLPSLAWEWGLLGEEGGKTLLAPHDPSGVFTDLLSENEVRLPRRSGRTGIAASDWRPVAPSESHGQNLGFGV